jgi:hypothetical protein
MFPKVRHLVSILAVLVSGYCYEHQNLWFSDFIKEKQAKVLNIAQVMMYIKDQALLSFCS